jgi:hypothetical protein
VGTAALLECESKAKNEHRTIIFLSDGVGVGVRIAMGGARVGTSFVDNNRSATRHVQTLLLACGKAHYTA